MGQMALGYGSEFHLLRWTGRHRKLFNEKVKKILEIDNIHWLDFNFNPSKLIPDDELKGIDFLNEEPGFQSLLRSWKNEWPQGGNVMNWDLVGYTNTDYAKAWVLVEAKAHIDEISQSCSAKDQTSINKINYDIDKAINNRFNIKANTDWLNKYYQFANRIYILDLLARHNINTKLLNIYFIGDCSSHIRKSPQNRKEWDQVLDDMKQSLGLININLEKLGIHNLYLNIDN